MNMTPSASISPIQTYGLLQNSTVLVSESPEHTNITVSTGNNQIVDDNSNTYSSVNIADEAKKSPSIKPNYISHISSSPRSSINSLGSPSKYDKNIGSADYYNNNCNRNSNSNNNNNSDISNSNCNDNSNNNTNNIISAIAASSVTDENSIVKVNNNSENEKENEFDNEYENESDDYDENLILHDGKYYYYANANDDNMSDDEQYCDDIVTGNGDFQNMDSNVEMFCQTAMSLEMNNAELMFNLMYFGGGGTQHSNVANIINSALEETVALHSEQNTPYKLKPAPDIILSKLAVHSQVHAEDDCYNGNGAELNCSVCRDVIDFGESFTRLPQCHHLFHTECILRWFKMQSWCPICRTSLLEATDSASSNNKLIDSSSSNLPLDNCEYSKA